MTSTTIFSFESLGICFFPHGPNPHILISYPTALKATACALATILAVHELRKDIAIHHYSQKSGLPPFQRIAIKAILAASFAGLGIAALIQNK